MSMRINILKKFTTESSTLDSDDTGLIKGFFFKSFLLTFGGVGLHKLAKSDKILGKIGIKP